MPDHLIRLRGGWLRLAPEAFAGASASPSFRRVVLPLTWPEEADSWRGVRLVRSFGPPPIDPDRESLSLRLSDVGGLVSIQLNGQEIARPAPGTSALEIPLSDPLLERNLLVLDVDVTAAIAEPGSPLRPWGAVALVIGSRFESPSESRAGDRDELLGGSGPRA